MKEALIFTGIALVVFQTLLLLAIFAAAARPIPPFEAEVKSVSKTPLREEERELELV
jgi:hypothetical protein